MTTYNIHDLVWSRGVSEPVREAILSLQAENASLRDQNIELDAKLAELERINAQLLEALEMGYADTMDYIQRNHLSGSENNHWLVAARAAIAAAKEGA